MKRKGFWTRDPWEYERSGEVVVFATDEKVSGLRLAVMKEIEEVLGEFSIPLSVVDGNSMRSEDIPRIEKLLIASLKGNNIDFDKFETGVHEVRKQGELPYGLVVLVDKNKYEFSSLTSQQPAIYGVGVCDGLILLRCIHKEAVHHEFGHMLGIGNHHSDCVMDYICPSLPFCNECKSQIAEMWQEEIARGR